eukprot:Gb_25388 [translate_table: standard]
MGPSTTVIFMENNNQPCKRKRSRKADNYGRVNEPETFLQLGPSAANRKDELARWSNNVSDMKYSDCDRKINEDHKSSDACTEAEYMDLELLPSELSPDALSFPSPDNLFGSEIFNKDICFCADYSQRNISRPVSLEMDYMEDNIETFNKNYRHGQGIRDSDQAAMYPVEQANLAFVEAHSGNSRPPRMKDNEELIKIFFPNKKVKTEPAEPLYSANCYRKPQFRDHIWTYAQMFRAEETTMAFMERDLADTIKKRGNPNIDSNGGLQLVQMLFACAEAVACRDARQASAIIKDLQYMASPYGSSLQRVAKCFIEGLTARLSVLIPSNTQLVTVMKEPTDKEKREALRLTYEFCPYIPFGHFAANSAIIEAFEGEEIVHIVDLGMTSSLSHGLQWRSLIQLLAIRPKGPPRLVRITGVGSCESVITEIGMDIKEYADSLDMPLEFHAVEESLENLHPSMLHLREGEALAVNSVLQLHCVVKESRGSLNSVLQSIHELKPRVLTLVEQDASHNGPFFLGRFMEALYYYSAIFDSVDAILPKYSTQRVKIEQFYFAEEIKNIVSSEGPARFERHERVDQWRRRMSRAGFQPSPLKIISQAKVWLAQHHPCDGYTLNEEKGCLVLGWRGKSIIAASCWKC